MAEVEVERELTTSTTERMAGFSDARENPDSRNAIDDDRWIVGYRVNRTNSIVLLGSLAPPVTDVLRRKHWTTLVRDHGWAFPLRYLAFVERLLAGAETPVELFDLDGAPTPGQIERGDRSDRTRLAAVLADNEAARRASQGNPEATDRARRECRQAITDAVAAARRQRSTSAKGPEAGSDGQTDLDVGMCTVSASQTNSDALSASDGAS